MSRKPQYAALFAISCSLASAQSFQERQLSFLPDLSLKRAFGVNRQDPGIDLAGLLGGRLERWLALPPRVRVQVVLGPRTELWVSLTKV